MKSSIQRGVRVAALASALALITALGTSSATADTASNVSSPEATAAQISTAAEATGTASVAANDDVQVSTTNGAAVVDTANGAVTLSTPSSGSGQITSDGLTTVYDGTAPDTSVAIQPTDSGIRAAIAIDSPGAPEAYSFQFGGDVASLVLNEDGTVTTLDAAGASVGEVQPAWALDADGNSVPTYYEVDGTTLIQVVQHKEGDYAYGIVADPWYNPFSWPWGKWVKKAASVIKSAIGKCAKGAVKTTLGALVGQSAMNIAISKYSATEDMVKFEGGGYALVSLAVGGCLTEAL